MVSVHFEVLEADYEFDYFGQWFGTVKLWTEEVFFFFFLIKSLITILIMVYVMYKK